jgi:hypothetical protein
LELEIEEVGVIDNSLDVREVNPVVDGLLSQGAMRLKVPVLEQKWVEIHQPQPRQCRGWGQYRC